MKEREEREKVCQENRKEGKNEELESLAFSHRLQGKGSKAETQLHEKTGKIIKIMIELQREEGFIH